MVNPEPEEAVRVVIEYQDDECIVDADEVKAHNLYAIRNNRKLNWLLTDWEQQFKVARERIGTETTRTNNAKSELYQWIGFFSVFQGVVLTAVAQSSTLGCPQSWAPASLSLIASVVTVVSVHFKLISYRDLEVNLAREIRESKILNKHISDLRTTGKDFNFSGSTDICPEVNLDREEEEKKKERPKERFYWAVILSLVLFSFIILLCCILVLCGPDKHKPGN